MEITEKIQKEEIILEITGRIDTNTSRLLQEKLLSTFQKSRNVWMDLKHVDYVSSAGLRVFLIGVKTAQANMGTLKFSGVQEQVMEVLQITGFDKVLDLWGDIQ
ncbi:MAG: STAS domain-containing protein [Ruminococcus sp.]|jgi:anti-sigma B factor antagonist|nr:STAS domain-containing protein [Ruminococcus sp.]